MEVIESLQKRIIDLCTSKKVLDGELFLVEELDEVWKKDAPEYMVNAVPEVKEFPNVAIAWACYFGLGVASLWDVDWDSFKDKDLYIMIRDKRGFDLMDEYVTQELLGCDEQDGLKLSELIGECSDIALTVIRKEDIEPQSTEAFYLFADITKLFFRLGVSLELYRMGYKYHKVQIEN